MHNINKKTVILGSFFLLGIFGVLYLIFWGRPASPPVSVVEPNELFGPLKPITSLDVSASAVLPQGVESQISEEAFRSLPKVGPVLKIEPDLIITRNLGQAIADNLDLMPYPSRLADRSLLWIDEEKSREIKVENDGKKLTYASILPYPEEGSVTLAQAVSVVEEFLLQSNLLFPDLKVSADLAKYAVINPEYINLVSETDWHNGVIVPIVRKVELETISIPNGYFNRYALVGLDGQIRLVKFPYQPIDVTNVGYYSLISPQEALLKAGQLKDTIFLSDALKDVKDISRLSYKTIELRLYEAEDVSDYIQPVYLFTGAAVMKDNTQIGFWQTISAIQQ